MEERIHLRVLIQMVQDAAPVIRMKIIQVRLFQQLPVKMDSES